jgi:hypothetical protein
MSLRQILADTAERVGVDERLDHLAGPIGDTVRRALDHQPTKDLLSGTWLGHPVHPLLTDLPIGFWTSAFTLDLVGGRHARRAATQLVAWGVLSAVPTAVTGASDWGDTTGPARRVGLVHAAANTTALACYVASWCARVRGRHTRGVAYGIAGATAATVGGYLGGHLVQVLAVGPDRSRSPRPPPEWTRVASVHEVTDVPRRALVKHRSSCCDTGTKSSRSTRAVHTGKAPWTRVTSTTAASHAHGTAARSASATEWTECWCRARRRSTCRATSAGWSATQSRCAPADPDGPVPADLVRAHDPERIVATA